MPRHKNLTYEEAAMILLHRKYPGIFLSGGVQITGEVSNIAPDDPRYIKGDVKAKYVPPPRKKLNVDPALLEAISAKLEGKQAVYVPPAPPAPPDAPYDPLFDIGIQNPPNAPSLFRESSRSQPRIIGDQQFQPMMQQHNFIDELKDYKDGLDYIRSMCPLLKGAYTRKIKSGTLNELSHQLAIKKIKKRLKKADKIFEEGDRYAHIKPPKMIITKEPKKKAPKKIINLL